MATRPPAGPVLVLLALGALVAVRGLGGAQVRELPWPEAPPLGAQEAADLEALRTLAVVEEVRPGAGRGRAAALARALLEARAGDDPSFTVRLGEAPDWGDGMVLDLAQGIGRGVWRMQILRSEARGPGAALTCVLVQLPEQEGAPAEVAAREYAISRGEHRALVRVLEALEGAFVDAKVPGDGPPGTVPVWSSALARGPGGEVRFEEAWGSIEESTMDAQFFVRSEIAGYLANLLLRDRAPAPHPLGAADLPWLRAAREGGAGEVGRFGECWDAAFAAAGGTGRGRRPE